MKALAVLAVLTGWCWDRFTLLNPTRGLPMASKAQRDLLNGRWS